MALSHHCHVGVASYRACPPWLSALAETPIAEIDELLRLIELGGPHVQVHTLNTQVVRGHMLQVTALTLGNDQPHVPGVIFVGGVHGLERIGAEVQVQQARDRAPQKSAPVNA